MPNLLESNIPEWWVILLQRYYKFMKMAWSIYYKNDDQSTRIEYTRVMKIVPGVMYHKAYMYLENDNSLPDFFLD